MKLSKLVELVENVNTFGEMFDLTGAVYESRSHDFEFVKKTNGYECRVVKVTKVLNGKDVLYKRTFVFKEDGKDMVESFRLAATKLLGK